MKSLISYIRYDVPQGLRSLLYWLPVVWRWRAWDWAFTVDVLIHSLKAQRELEVRHQRHADWEAQAREMSICIEALERLGREERNDMLELAPGDKLFDKRLQVREDAFYGSVKAVLDYEAAQRKMYLEIATRQLRQHLTKWWD